MLACFCKGCTILGVPYWGPYYKGILLLGDLHWESPIFVKSHLGFNEGLGIEKDVRSSRSTNFRAAKKSSNASIWQLACDRFFTAQFLEYWYVLPRKEKHSVFDRVRVRYRATAAKSTQSPPDHCIGVVVKQLQSRIHLKNRISGEAKPLSPDRTP